MVEMNTLSLFEYYKKEIIFFSEKLDKLLVKTIMQEIKIAKRKRKRLRSTKKRYQTVKKFNYYDFKSNCHCRNLSIFPNGRNSTNRSKYTMVLC